MNKEEKELLLIDLCARLPYEVFVEYEYCDGVKRVTKLHGNYLYLMMLGKLQWIDFKPYLRPMSSMTDVERKDYQYITERWMYDTEYSIADSIDWLNANHFDYRGLIEKGLALEAPEGMYETPNMKEQKIMTEQEKQILLKHLCAILPYGVKYCREYWDYERDQEMCAVGTLESIDKDGYINDTKVYTVWDIKPYLRPMSSMTEEELNECVCQSGIEDIECPNWQYLPKEKQFEARLNHAIAVFLTECNDVDWLNAHHFDYRGLIGMGLALEAPEGMYKTKTE